MKHILKMFITFIVLTLGTCFLGKYIVIINIQTVIIAALLIEGIDLLISIVCYFLTELSVAELESGPKIEFNVLSGCLGLLASFFLVIFMAPIELLILNKYLPGFHINGFWTYTLLSILLILLSINITKND